MSDVILVEGQGQGAVSADCNDEDVVTGGGHEVSGLNEVNPHVSQHKSGNGWQVQVLNLGSNPIEIAAFAECTKLVPVS